MFGILLTKLASVIYDWEALRMQIFLLTLMLVNISCKKMSP